MLSGACSKDHYFDLLFPLLPISNNGCSLSHICTFFLSWIFSASLVSLCLKCCVDWGPRKPQELSQALSTWPLGLWWARPFPEHPGWCQEESGNEEHDLQQGNTPGSCDLWEELPARQEAGTQGIPTPHRAKMPHWSCARSQAYTIQDLPDEYGLRVGGQRGWVALGDAPCSSHMRTPSPSPEVQRPEKSHSSLCLFFVSGVGMNHLLSLCLPLLKWVCE